jgi:hypothetical protein
MPLLLERITHIGLSIQLDVQDGSLRVNGEVLPLLSVPSFPYGPTDRSIAVSLKARASPSQSSRQR